MGKWNGRNFALAQRHDECCRHRDRGLGSNVYVAGYASLPTNNETVAVYWINGTPQILPSPSGTTNAYTTAITVSSSDVYVAGYTYNNNSAGNGPAVYWVNGTIETLPLPSGTTHAEANAIAVSGSNVYVAGYAFNTANNPQENGPAAYWMNGTLESLPLPAA